MYSEHDRLPRVRFMRALKWILRDCSDKIRLCCITVSRPNFSLSEDDVSHNYSCWVQIDGSRVFIFERTNSVFASEFIYSSHGSTNCTGVFRGKKLLKKAILHTKYVHVVNEVNRLRHSNIRTWQTKPKWYKLKSLCANELTRHSKQERQHESRNAKI